MDSETVVVELLAKLEGFDTKVKQSATTFDDSMKKIETAGSRAEKAVVDGSAKRGAAVKREAADIAAASSRMSSGFADLSSLLSGSNAPFVKIATQAPLSTKALGLLASAAGGVGAIMTGVAIPALLAGAGALFKLATSGGEANDAIEALLNKMKEQARQAGFNEDANRLWEASIDGVREAQRKLNKEVADSIPTEQQQSEHQLATARDTVAARTRDLEKAQKDLAAARKALAAARSAPAQGGLASGGGFNAGEAAAVKRVTDLEARVNTLKRTLSTAEQAVRSAGVKVGEGVAKGIADTQVGINQFFDRLVAETKEAANRSDSLNASLAGNLTAIEKARAGFLALDKAGKNPGNRYDQIVAQTNGLNSGRLAADKYAAGIAGMARALDRAAAAAKKLADEKKKIDNSGRQAGRIVDLQGAKSILAGIGVGAGDITSTLRTPEHNREVGGQPNSYHLTGQAIDIRKVAGLTLSKIVKAFEEKGVRLIEKLDEGDHFHIAFAKQRGAGRRGPSAETLARRADAEHDAPINRQKAADAELASLNQSLIDAKQSLVESAEEIAKLEMESIDLARDDYNKKLKQQQDIGTLLEGEVTELTRINNERAELRKELVRRREDQRKFRVAEAEAQLKVDRQIGGIGVEQDLLQSRAGIAQTAKDRRNLERRLINLQFQEERIQNDAIIAAAERLRIEAERIKIKRALTDAEQQELDRAMLASDVAKQRNGTAPEREANATTTSDTATAGPLETYFGPIKKDAADLDTAFENIAAGGLATFTDALTDAIVNFTSLKDVGRAVLQSITAGLVKLAIQQVILATAGKAIGLSSALATKSLMVGIGASAAGPAALVATATLGGASVAANAGLASTAALTAVIGAPRASGGKIIGPGSDTSDNILTPLSPNEFVIKARSARALGYPLLEHINRTGTLPAAGLADGGAVGVAPGTSAPIAPGFVKAGAADSGLSGAAARLTEAADALEHAAEELGGGKKKKKFGGLLGAGLGLLSGGILGGGPKIAKKFGFSTGGRIFGPGTSTSDSVPIMSSNDEFVIRASSARKLGFAALERMNMTGEMPGIGASFAAGGRIGGLTIPRPTNASAIGAGNAARVGMDDDFRRELRGLIGEAVHAMPNVKMVNVLDAGDVTSAGVNTRPGEQALFNFITKNAGRINSALAR